MIRLKKLIIACVLVFCLLAVSGCVQDAKVPSEYSVYVTYYFNGGRMESYNDETSIQIAYKPNSRIAEPGVTAGVDQVLYTGRSLGGWYIAETDADGKVVLDENEKPKASSVKFDFKTKVSESITLVAVWGRAVRVTYKNLIYSEADTSREYYKVYDAGESVQKPSYNVSFDDSGNRYSVEGFYWNAAFTDEITEWPISTEVIEQKTVGGEVDSSGYLIVQIYVKVSTTPITE